MTPEDTAMTVTVSNAISSVFSGFLLTVGRIVGPQDPTGGDHWGVHLAGALSALYYLVSRFESALRGCHSRMNSSDVHCCPHFTWIARFIERMFSRALEEGRWLSEKPVRGHVGGWPV